MTESSEEESQSQRSQVNSQNQNTDNIINNIIIDKRAKKDKDITKRFYSMDGNKWATYVKELKDKKQKSKKKKKDLELSNGLIIKDI